MGYLRARDYIVTIQDANLQQVIAADQSVLILAEQWAQTEMISYLVQKFDTSQEFKPTTVWSNTKSYLAGSLVEINYPAYAPATPYTVSSLVIYNAIGYICIQAGTGQLPATSPTYWTPIGAQYQLYYVAFPKPVFDNTTYYSIGDQVFWKDKTYTCKVATPIIGHNTIIQYPTYADLPRQNVFPDDPVNGVQVWAAGVPYTVTAGTLPTDPKWAAGDNRNQQLVGYMGILAIYRASRRLAYRNCPPQWTKDFNEVLIWLELAAKGEVTADLPILQPIQGRRIRYGGNIKNNNSY